MKDIVALVVIVVVFVGFVAGIDYYESHKEAEPVQTLEQVYANDPF